ncbi:hypothetical protein Dimus_015834 [Dionaea muscipula]
MKTVVLSTEEDGDNQVKGRVKKAKSVSKEVRLQLEALLAEKSRLAYENTDLTRENQCLRQLVEYHQFASQDLSASYENLLEGICLDFSSPLATPTGEDAIDGDTQDSPNSESSL